MSFFGFMLLSYFLDLFHIFLSLSLSGWFSIVSFFFHSPLKLLSLQLSISICITSLLLSVTIDNFLTVLISPVDICLILLFCLVLKELLDTCFLQLFGIESFLDFKLINFHFPVSSFSFLTCKLIIILGFFDFIHCSGVREVLDLSRRNAFLFFLSLYGVLDTDTFFNTKFSHIFMELVNTIHLLRLVCF